MASRMVSVSSSNGDSCAFKASELETYSLAKSVTVDYGTRLAVLLTHPGYVATRMNKFQSQMGTEESVAGTMKSVRNTNAHGNVRFIVWHGEDIAC